MSWNYQAQTLSCESISIVSNKSDCDTYQRIPRASAQTDTVITYTQAADPVFVTAQRSDLVTTKNVPNLE
jgi:hypothetical protein